MSMNKNLAIQLTSLMNEVEALIEQDQPIPDAHLAYIGRLGAYLRKNAPELLDPRFK